MAPGELGHLSAPRRGVAGLGRPGRGRSQHTRDGWGNLAAFREARPRPCQGSAQATDTRSAAPRHGPTPASLQPGRPGCLSNGSSSYAVVTGRPGGGKLPDPLPPLTPRPDRSFSGNNISGPARATFIATSPDISRRKHAHTRAHARTHEAKKCEQWQIDRWIEVARVQKFPKERAVKPPCWACTLGKTTVRLLQTHLLHGQTRGEIEREMSVYRDETFSAASGRCGCC